MAFPELDGLEGVINTDDLYSGLINALPPEMLEKFNFMLDIMTAILVISLIYVLILIIFKIINIIFGDRAARRLKKISDSLEVTNKYLEDIMAVLGKRRGKIGGKKLEESGEKKKNKR